MLDKEPFRGQCQNKIAQENQPKDSPNLKRWRTVSSPKIDQARKRIKVKQRNICTKHCKENHVYVFIFWELLGLSPNFHIHVSVRDLYIPKMGDRSRKYINIYRYMRIEIGRQNIIILFSK